MDEKNYLHPKKNLINFVANFSFFKLFKILEQIGRFCKAVVNFIMIFFVFGKKSNILCIFHSLKKNSPCYFLYNYVFFFRTYFANTNTQQRHSTVIHGK